jgi:predicted dehydrogenase
MNDKRLGVGIVGGGFVASFHIRSWVGVRHSDIRGVVTPPDGTGEAAVALANELGVGPAQYFTSITDMVADPDIDAIWICAPNFTRIEVMEEIAHAVESGKGELVGVACEKPLGRNAAEARRMLELVQRAGLLDGYLENQLFTPGIMRGKEILWTRGAALTGPPYLARAAEEHSGPHMPWFWEGELQGGGVLNDMMCHSVEVARFLLTPPGAERDVLTPRSRRTFPASSGSSRTMPLSSRNRVAERRTTWNGPRRTSRAPWWSTATRTATSGSSKQPHPGATWARDSGSAWSSWGPSTRSP